MKILITGASGYIGAAVFSALKQSSPNLEVSGTYHRQPLFPELLPLSLENPEDTKVLLTQLAPDWIIHIAAIPSQSGFDSNPAFANQVNISGTLKLFEFAEDLSAKLLFLSSEAVAHESLYGESKRQAEAGLRERVSRWTILRPGTTYGLSPNISNPRPFNRLLQAAQQRRDLEMDDREIYCLTWLKHLSEVIGQVIERDILGEIVPVVLSRGASRFEVARELLKDCPTTVRPLNFQGERLDYAHLTQTELLRLGLSAYDFDSGVASMRAELMEGLR